MVDYAKLQKNQQQRTPETNVSKAKLASYKVTIQMSSSFLHTSNEQYKIKIKNAQTFSTLKSTKEEI